MELLDDLLIEMMQDDDVDTDDDVLDCAFNNCWQDLIRAFRKVEPTNIATNNKDGQKSINYHLLNNYRIKDRTKNPEMYDRNGLLRDIPKDQKLDELAKDIDEALNKRVPH